MDFGAPRLSTVILNASVSQIFVVVLTLLFIKWVAKGVYRVYFHPLSGFPGPRFSAFTRLPQIRAIWTGTMPMYIRRLHEVYGDVVRLAPDELSFMDPQAWRDIYGHGSKGTRGSAPPKHFRRYGAPANGSYNLLQSRDADHARVRRIFSSAFSDRALKQQEPLFNKYVDKLIVTLKRRLAEDPQQKIDMVRMYNFTTFDVMGDLTFGESMHMLDNAEYHPWVSLIFGSVKFGSRTSILHHYPIAARLFRWLVPRSALRKRVEHQKYSGDRVTKRLEKGRDSEGVDLWDLVLSQKEEERLTRGEMDANSSLFMIAGTETTATLLSGLTYLLLKTPAAMKKLVYEVRTSPEMSMDTLAALPYLNACIKEALRLYPPVAVGLPHLTPPDGSTICGQYVPPGFTVTAPHSAMYRSAKLFRDPEVFVPERWLGDTRYSTDQRNAVQPFSVGPRNCLGQNMAYHEMRLLMSKVLYNFDLELCPESDNWMDQRAFILWQKTPLMIKVKSVAAS